MWSWHKHNFIKGRVRLDVALKELLDVKASMRSHRIQCWLNNCTNATQVTHLMPNQSTVWDGTREELQDWKDLTLETSTCSSAEDCTQPTVVIHQSLTLWWQTTLIITTVSSVKTLRAMFRPNALPETEGHTHSPAQTDTPELMLKWNMPQGTIKTDRHQCCLSM